MDAQRREDQLLDKIRELMIERDTLRTKNAELTADLIIAVEAALAR